MKFNFRFISGFTALILLAGCAGGNGSTSTPPPNSAVEKRTVAPFEVVASFDGQQPTGVSASKDGRIFANFLRWREGVKYSVVEIHKDGTATPYPNAAWNTWNGKARKNNFTCVQSVVAHGNSLFVLDPASPEINDVLGQAMLYEFDLQTNKLKNKWSFNEQIAPRRSYLNDLRIDDQRGLIYITDSGLGAIVVLDMKSGLARRLLEDDPSTKSEPIAVYPYGKALTKTNGLPNQFHVDGIEFVDDYVYYHAVTAVNFYRIPAAVLADLTLSSAEVAKSVEALGITPKPDGLAVDKNKNIYMADLEKNAIVYRSPDGKISTLVQDSSLHWADTFSIDSQNRLLFSDSRLDQVGPEKSAEGYTFYIYRTPLK